MLRAAFIFPAVRLGVVASHARRVMDRMMQAAATALGELSPAATHPQVSLLPRVYQPASAPAWRATARNSGTVAVPSEYRAGVGSHAIDRPAA
jgi:malic enzyme